MKTIKHLFLTSILFLLFGNFNYAQEPTYEWVKQMGGSNSDWGEAIAVDNSGNVFTTGVFAGTVDFDPGSDSLFFSAVAVNDIFIQKLDALGNLVWVKHIGGTGYIQTSSITVDDYGNVYTTGRFGGVADFDPGLDSLNLTSVGNDDIFILKQDDLGNLVWAKQIGGTYNDRGKSIVVDQMGNVYTTGGFEELVDFDPGPDTLNLYAGLEDETEAFILKLDEWGELIWVKQIGEDGEAGGISLAFDSDENLLIAGGFQSNVDFDPGPDTFYLSSVGFGDSFILKLDTSGDFIWVKHIMSGSGSISIRSMAIDELDNIYTTGGFEGTVDFDPESGTVNLSSTGWWDIFIQKLDSDGNLVWVKQFGGSSIDRAYWLATDNSNNSYITGQFSSTIDFDPGPEIFTLTPDNYDVFILKLSSSGSFEWVKQLGGLDKDRGESIAVDNFGNIFTTGFFRSTFDIDTGLDIINLSSAGGYDAFVHKMSQCALSPNITSDGDTHICEGESLTVTASSGENYLWNTGDTTASITVSPSMTTNFSVVVSDGTGCSGSGTIQITVEPHPNAQFDYAVNGISVDFTNLSSSNATDFQWNFGDNSPESIEENPSHFYDQPGVYLVTLVATNEFCGSAISQNVEVLTTSTKTIVAESLIEIYPNPVQDLLHFKSEIKIDHIRISNILGQQVLEIKDAENIDSIDLRYLLPGTYVITFLSNDHLWSTEFLKQ